MLDDKKISEIISNINIAEGDNAFQGAMPAGECKLVAVATEPQDFNGNKWYPVTFKTAQGNYDLSLKGLLQAEGLQYSTRNLKERVKAWYELNETNANAASRKFTYGGKKEREITYRRDIVINNVQKHAGDKGMMSYHTFATKMVG